MRNDLGRKKRTEVVVVPHSLIPSSPHLRTMPYFPRITRTLSSGIAGTVRPRLVTVVAMNIEL